jgi:hypothetical protein
VLTEDAVINSVCDYLAADGWKIASRAMPNQRGTDVVATRAGTRLEVEAKGAGSSKPHTGGTGNRSTRPKSGFTSARQCSRLSQL